MPVSREPTGPRKGLPVASPTMGLIRVGGAGSTHAPCTVGPTFEQSGQFEGPKSVTIAREGLGSRSSCQRSVSPRFPAFPSSRRHFSPRNSTQGRRLSARVHTWSTRGYQRHTRWKLVRHVSKESRSDRCVYQCLCQVSWGSRNAGEGEFRTFIVLLEMFVAWKISIEWLPILLLLLYIHFRCFHAGDR